MRYSNEPNYQEAIASSLSGLEELYLEKHNQSDILEKTLAGIIKNKKDSVINPIYVNVSVKEDGRTNGLKLFRSICAACHGPSGDGIAELAPPLRESEYVTGSLQNAYVHDKKGISAKEIKALRNAPPKNGYPYTEQQLLEMDFEN